MISRWKKELSEMQKVSSTAEGMSRRAEGEET